MIPAAADKQVDIRTEKISRQVVFVFPAFVVSDKCDGRRIDTNPVVYGIRLSDEQLRKIGEGEYIRLENMKREDGTLFSGYVVMDDRFRASWIFRQPPDRIVKEDKFYIREMDKLLILFPKVCLR